MAEPMSAAEGNNCRKAIFMKLAQLKKETGSLSFIVPFLTEIKEMNHFKEQDYINALIRSQGSPESLKVFFKEKGCL